MTKLQTDIQNLEINEIQLFRLAEVYHRDFNTFRQFCEISPFVVNVNHRSTLDTTFSNPALQQLLELPLEEIRTKGFTHIRSISDPLVLKLALNKIRQFDALADQTICCGYFQHIIFQQKPTWYYTHKMFLNGDFYLNLAYPIKMLGQPGHFMDDILGEAPMGAEGWQRFQSLTAREKEILFMVAEGLETREISDRLFISAFTVKTHRRNIIGKIEARNLADIIKYVQALQLLGIAAMNKIA